jgi:hypothetical protein
MASAEGKALPTSITWYHGEYHHLRFRAEVVYNRLVQLHLDMVWVCSPFSSLNHVSDRIFCVLQVILKFIFFATENKVLRSVTGTPSSDGCFV